MKAILVYLTIMAGVVLYGAQAVMSIQPSLATSMQRAQGGF
jgi:hypothetical protein